MDGKDELALKFRQNEALARRRRDSNRRPRMDPTCGGPVLALLRAVARIDPMQPARLLGRYLTPSPPPTPSPQAQIPHRAYMPFGQRLLDLRRALRWTQREAAAHLGVSVRSVIRHERNQSHRAHDPLDQRLRELEAVYARDLACYARDLGRR
jgi:hypothetical protein